ncbi:hypothetical protein AUR04nite_04790 [Glutamicibacter uratoxydans]|uniref:Uncharacterized protein n=1 Tax=Glutamicibacter uratoxydans TaxID=43667 RepID=A0A4Y4DJZ9_GLUUR|nr:hypothetical protein [Glutamicibacter uratoxydans]GED04947.1 hypothetical protein AUR04nite_04790 [Glutamicibacter uratoxydans]
MRQTLLHLHLDDEQIDDLNSALCTYRDHFIELAESSMDAVTPLAQENAKYWQDKVRQVQELIDKINDELYGHQERGSARKPSAAI